MTETKGKILKWTIFVLLLCYCTGMGIWAHYQAQNHVCTGIEVEVTGNAAMDSVVKAGIMAELKTYPKRIVGTRIQELDMVGLDKFLRRLNNFESVHCVISPRGKLVVLVEPLVPVMRVFFGDRSYYVNKEGKSIVSNAEFYKDVPVVTGRFTSTFTPKQVLPLVEYINKDAMLKELVTMIEAKDSHNLILIPRIKGHVINFGDTLHLDEKKKNLALFYREVMPYKGWEEYDTISVKYHGQIVATRRDKSRLNHAEEYEEEVDLEEATLPTVNETGSEAAEQGNEIKNNG